MSLKFWGERSGLEEQILELQANQEINGISQFIRLFAINHQINNKQRQIGRPRTELWGTLRLKVWKKDSQQMR